MIYYRREAERIRQGLNFVFERNGDRWYAGVYIRVGPYIYKWRYRNHAGVIQGFSRAMV